MPIDEFIIELFCRVDDRLGPTPRRGRAKLARSELVTLGLLFAIKGDSGRDFYRWVSNKYRHFFPKLPECTRLFRRLIACWEEAIAFLADPTLLGVVDTYGRQLGNWRRGALPVSFRVAHPVRRAARDDAEPAVRPELAASTEAVGRDDGREQLRYAERAQPWGACEKGPGDGERVHLLRACSSGVFRRFVQPPEQPFNERQADPRLAASHCSFVVFGQAAVTIQPPKAALHDPALGQDDESFRTVASLDDLDAEARIRRRLINDLADVRAINEGRFEP
jgi:hypothetical protein